MPGLFTFDHIGCIEFVDNVWEHRVLLVIAVHILLPGFHTEGGRGGGLTPLMILARGDIPPIKLQNSVFLMGILVKSFKKVFRRQIPFFLANLCFLIVPPPLIFFLAETLTS